MKILSRRPPRREGWASTHWSVLLQIQEPVDCVREDAWTYLVSTYRPPMEAFVRHLLAVNTGRAQDEDAREVVQDFFATCVQKDWLSQADPARGRFRGYVRVLLRRHLFHRIRHDNAQRRRPSGGRAAVPLHGVEPAGRTPPPEEHAAWAEFDRSWVKVAVDRAIQRLGEERPRYQEVVVDLLATHGEGSEDLAARMGVRGEQLPVLKHRARQRFASVFAEEVALTVDGQVAFEEEWRELQPFLP